MTRLLLLARACLLGVMCAPAALTAAPPTGLMTDLIEHTDRVWINGYPTQMTLEEAARSIEPVQMALIYNRRPMFSWVLNDVRPDVKQTFAQIQVGTSREQLSRYRSDMWNARFENNDNSTTVIYDGEPLKPNTVYYWKVRTDNNNAQQDWSEIRAFRTADTLYDYKTAYYPQVKSDERPVSVERLPGGDLAVDFGRASFGQLVLTLDAQQADTIIVRIGEALRDGRLDRKPDGTIRYREHKLALLPGRHTYRIKIMPDTRNTRNTPPLAVPMPEYVGEVLPFRYLEIEGYKHDIAPADIERQTVHYPFNDFAVHFTSSDTVLNRVWELCRYSVKATSFAGIYVDGDRERIPYEADALLNQLCHYSVDREFTLARRSHEYLLNHATWPTEWILQSVLIAWYDYLYTGDIRSAEANYSLLKNKTLSALEEEDGLIVVLNNPKVDSALRDSIRLPQNQKLDDIVDWPRGEFTFMPKNISPNVFHYASLELMGKLAGAMGKKADSAAYASQAARTATSINKYFFDKKSGLYRDGIGTDHVSVYSNMFPIVFSLVPPQYQPRIADYLVSRGMDCSVYAAQFLLDALYDTGKADAAFKLLTATDLRSWYNMIRAGSTITMEAWDILFKYNQDWNHIWGAVPANVIPRKLMGIEPVEPGFRRARIKPQPGPLRTASITMPTIRGDVGVSFDNAPGRFVLEVAMPVNMVGDVYLPLYSQGRFTLTMDGKSLPGVKAENGFIKVPDVGSGKHVFELTFAAAR